jgi:hypothetical protein
MGRTAHGTAVMVNCFDSFTGGEHRTSCDRRMELAQNKGHWRAITSTVIHLLIIS